MTLRSINFFRLFFCIVALFFCCAAASAQIFEKKNYPQQYFQWPVGAAIGIVANFGELRPNHYHMGLDCRTDQVENRPVYAAADGYIAKVKIESFGFGRCIYINHPNGLTTLYAHLNTFNPALEKYITEQQYRLRSWAVFLDIPAKLFPVKQGDFIASSGNTGGSQGPHTHFEIRDTKSDKNLNPLLFGMPIPDNVPPDIMRLAVYDRTISTYDQIPKIYPLKKINGLYTVIGKVTAPSDKVSFAITASDRVSGSSNPNGIYAAAVFDNDKRISSFELDSISYDDTRYLNAHIDYKFRSSGGSWLQHLSPLPGYTVNTVYKTDESTGIVTLGNTSHSIKIIVADANENLSALNFTLEPPLNNTPKKESLAGQKFIPDNLNVFENEDVRFYLPGNALYDTVNFIYKKTTSAAGKNIYQLHTGAVPVHTYFTVNIKEPIAVADTGKVVMERFYGGKTDFKKADFKNGWFSASFREFGNYQLLIDRVPPLIIPVGFKDGMNAARLNRILFTVTDNSEDLQSFTALLDGNWLRFSNDKARNFIYVFDDHCPPGQHELKITAVDMVGNVTEKVYHFTR